MISLKELNPHSYPTTPTIDINLQDLLTKINVIRLHYGQPLTVSSGLRSQAKQQELIAAGISNAPKSKHLTGQAVDILDTDGVLQSWVLNNVALLESIPLWCESFGSTPNWCHFQTLPPRSGKRFFNP